MYMYMYVSIALHGNDYHPNSLLAIGLIRIMQKYSLLVHEVFVTVVVVFTSVSTCSSS